MLCCVLHGGGYNLVHKTSYTYNSCHLKDTGFLGSNHTLTDMRVAGDIRRCQRVQQYPRQYLSSASHDPSLVDHVRASSFGQI